MKTIIFVAAIFLSSFSFAGERVFDCSAKNLSQNPDIAYADFNLQQNPRVLLIEGSKNWSLHVGDYSITTLDPNGPALWREVSSEEQGNVRYDFWVDASYELEVVINAVDYSANVYWWGLGERTELGSFTCEVSVK